MPQNYSRDTLRQGEDFASVLKDTLCKYVKGHLKTIRALPPHVRAAPWDRPAPGTLWAHKAPRNASVSVALPAPCPASAPSQPQRPLQLKNPQLVGLQGLRSMATSLHCLAVRAKGSLGKDPMCLLPKHGLEEESQAPPEPGPPAPALETLPGVPACSCPSPAPSAWSPSLLQP